jgi:membrane protease subunit (stomatin/prohibitin family)
MLKSHFYTIKIEKGSSMKEFLLGMKKILIQNGSIGDLINDEGVVLIVLNTLPSKFETFV